MSAGDCKWYLLIWCDGPKITSGLSENDTVPTFSYVNVLKFTGCDHSCVTQHRYYYLIASQNSNHTYLDGTKGDNI